MAGSKNLTPMEAVRKRKHSLLTRRGYAALGLQILCIGAALWIVFGYVFLIYRNRGLEMYPAVKDGDLVLAYRLHREYGKGDMVIYRMDGTLCLGRIAAMGTDVVEMGTGGSVTVNGNPQNGEILYPTYARENTAYPLRVQEGMVFILGDYRTQAQDSRDFGPIPMNDIQGKAIALVRRRGL